MDASQTRPKKTNPRETAWFPSIVTFCFTRGLFQTALARPLDDGDVYQIRPGLASAKLGQQLEAAWESTASLLKSLWVVFGARYLLLGFLQLVVKTAVIFVQPAAVGRLVAYFQPGQEGISRGDLYVNAVLVVGLSLFTTLYNHNYEQLIQEVGIRVKTAVSALVYRKSLKLPPQGFSKTSTGKIVTLITKDVNAFENALTFVNDMWIGVIQTGIIGYILFRRVGSAVLLALGLYVVVVPIQLFLGKKSSAKRVGSAEKTDERLQITTEALSAIKTIKMYTWESYFVQKITELRKNEISKLAPVFYLKCLVLIAGGLGSNVAFLFLMLTYMSSYDAVDAATVYFIYTCFQSLKGYISVSIPYGIAQCSEVHASLRRLDEFLALEHTHTHTPTPLTPRILLQHVSVDVGELQLLKDVSLEATQGLHLVTGNVGCGKTTLLKTLLGEYPSRGEVLVHGVVSYASQDPWLFPGSIKQNILFGEAYDERRYNEVVRVCALRTDFSRLRDGDRTVLGDRGVNLSKGQQGRINLARAVYKNSDIYLLDDCLSALDNKVGLFVFKKCIGEFLRGKIVVLVTQNPSHIKMAGAQNLLVIEDGSTLSLEQQSSKLDKRITHYIDDEDSEAGGMVDEEEEVLDDEATSENLQLLDQAANAAELYYEEKHCGKVSLEVYWKYFKFAGGLCIFLLTFAVFLLGQVASSYADKLLSQWVNTETQRSTMLKNNQKLTTEYLETSKRSNYYLYLYSVLIVGASLLIVLRVYLVMYRSALTAARKLHTSITNSVMNSYMSFFDGHYVGNIVNRFSKDMNTTDEVLPLVIYEIFRLTLSFIGIVYLIVSVNNWFVIVATVLLSVMFLMRKFYIPTGRSTKRLEAATRSPMIGYLNASLEGLTTIRASGKEALLVEEFEKHQDHYTSAYYMMICTTRAFGLYLDLISVVFTAAIVLLFVLFFTDSTAGDVGLAISQSMMLSGLLQWVVRYYSELENNMTAVERVLEYTDIPREQKTQGPFKENWPSNGIIQYDGVSLTYQRTKQVVLRNVSFLTFAREKIGVVGRTGAGKSSIISTLFRLYDFEGRILVDGEDVKELPVALLRSSIAIIPQDPVLFTGTIRSNIDPSSKYSDEDIWEAISKSNVSHLVNTLEDTVWRNWSNFSAGQKQLVCLARALVSRSKILVLDEATANMDSDTCRLLQETIKKNFAQCTVLIIAHRLSTISETDRVMVVDGGEIVEFDTPSALMGNQDGLFYKLMKQTEPSGVE